MITRNARLHPDDPFLVYGAQCWTHDIIHARAMRLAAALAAAGCERQDRVSILAMNCPEYLEVFAANWIAGYVTATVNFRLAAPELLQILRDTRQRF